MIEKAFAKINIGLNIVEKRKDRYHNIDTVMQTLDLHDIVDITKTTGGIKISCSNPGIPVDNTNTTYRAAELFFEKSAINIDTTGVHIKIQKNIPSEAGLGGGSSDAAATLRVLNSLFCTNYGTQELIDLASQIGSDIPFLITGGTMRAMGRGEIMKPVKSFAGVDTVIIMPDVSVSTKKAYEMFQKHPNPIHPEIDQLVSKLDSNNPSAISEFMGNTFESLIFPIEPLIEKAKHDILKTAPLACSMTGSGSAIYGFYSSHIDAQKAYDLLSGKYNVFITKTIGGIN